MERTITTKKIYKIFNIKTNEVMPFTVELPNIKVTKKVEETVLKAVLKDFGISLDKMQELCITCFFVNSALYKMNDEDFMKYATLSSEVIYSDDKYPVKYSFDENDFKKEGE